MLLCDGCDAACHIECLRPTLPEVPEVSWLPNVSGARRAPVVSAAGFCSFACTTALLQPCLYATHRCMHFCVGSKRASSYPQCEWFCWSCELQLQDVALPAAAAGRCVSLLLQQEAGRRLMCGHKCFGSVLQVGTHATVTNSPRPTMLQ